MLASTAIPVTTRATVPSLEGIDVNDLIIVPEYFAIVFHKFLLTALIFKQFVQVFLQCFIAQDRQRPIQNSAVNIAEQQWIQLAKKKIPVGIDVRSNYLIAGNRHESNSSAI